MTRWQLAIRSLWFYWRTNVGALLGATTACMVLVGALVVGDCVKATLRSAALSRVGRAEFAMSSGDRLFSADLAGRVAKRARAKVAAMLVLPGVAVSASGDTRVNDVQVLGVDGGFVSFAPCAGRRVALAPEQVALNHALAMRLDAAVGDLVLLVVDQPTALSRDMPLSSDERASTALRVEVAAIVDNDTFGSFSLRSGQAAPYNVFAPREWFAQQLNHPGRANLLIARPSRNDQPLAASQYDQALRAVLNPDDLQWKITSVGDHEHVQSARVFFQTNAGAALRATSDRSIGILTYFVNALTHGEHSTPYSMVSAIEAGKTPLIPADMRDDEVVINQWLADDLQAGVGNEIELSYYVVGPGRQLIERSRSFRVHDVVPLQGLAGDRTLMPGFPGLKDSENCREWDPGFAIDLSRIRDRDEAYWDDHRGTPKAFVTLASGRDMWRSRWGDLTAVRFPPETVTEHDVLQLVQEHSDPASLGFQWSNVRVQALRAGAQSLDFGGLFVALSLFIVVSALLLTALLYLFGVEQRRSETGALLAVGWTPAIVRTQLLREALVLAAIASVIGTAAGLGYTMLVLWALNSIWSGAVASTVIAFHVDARTLVGGLFASVLVAVWVIYIAVRRQGRQPVRALLLNEPDRRAPGMGRLLWVAETVLVFALVVVAGVVGFSGDGGVGSGAAAQSSRFFDVGMLLLVAGVVACHAVLVLAARRSVGRMVSLPGLALRNAARRHWRSVATIALLACGTFLIASIGVFRLGAVRDPYDRTSGTGGFALYGTTTLPVLHALNTKKGREHFALADDALRDVRIVPMRVHDGDDASCLNLNRAQQPRLLGVDPALLGERGALTFSGHSRDVSKHALQRWDTLDAPWDSVVPAVGDEATVRWALMKKLGDVVPYTTESGEHMKAVIVGTLANSILQGSLVVSKTRFEMMFPSEPGYRAFLIDCPTDRVDEVSATLTRALEDVGLSLERTGDRLARFNTVQNTYLTIFQALGGLGVVLGSFGLGAVVLRNVLERRRELATLVAVGFTRGKVRGLVIAEHAGLLAGGLLVGVLSAAAAVLPVAPQDAGASMWLATGLTLGGVALAGGLWVVGASLAATGGNIIQMLRRK